MSKQYLFFATAIMSIVTIALRFIPFWVFGGGRKTPKRVAYLGKVLPSAIMGMLVVYCLKDVSISAVSGWLPAIVASLTVVVLHVWRRNTMLSIVAGTAVYMLLIRIPFL